MVNCCMRETRSQANERLVLCEDASNSNGSRCVRTSERSVVCREKSEREDREKCASANNSYGRVKEEKTVKSRGRTIGWTER
jgi:hypothetical protein